MPDAVAETLARAAGGLPEMAESLVESNYLQTARYRFGMAEHDPETRILCV